MDWKIFGVLLWKHWCVRKRRIIFTILEYLTPIVLFLLLHLLKVQFVGESPRATSKSTSYLDIQRPEALRLRDTSSPKCILFTPNTEFTRHLMELVGRKLKLNPHEYLPDELLGNGDYLLGSYPFNHTSEISNFTKSPEMRDDDAVVIFQSDDSAVPDNLKYTIRMKRHFMTYLDTSIDGELVPHQNFGTIYEPFMKLQWAIDTAYLEMKTGKEVKQDVVLQEFPFAHRATAAAVELTVALVSACAFFSLVLMFTLLVARLVGERTNGVQELMKMSGVSSASLAAAHFLDTLPALLSFSISGATFLTIGPPALLENTNGFLLFVCLLLHSCTIVAFGFVCGYLVRSMEYTNTLAATLFIAIAVFSDAIQTYVPGALQPALGLVPTLPLRWVLRQVAILGRYGAGLTFYTVARDYSPAAPSALVAMIFMVAQTVFYMLLAWYLDHVLPGKLGLAMPWNFLCQKQYWRKNDIVPEIDVDEGVSINAREEQYFEPAPANVEVGIKAVNITKVFPNHVALNNVSLDVYKGELTILLGHNGAGKTTLMSIMTGTLNPTLGAVYVNGQDIGAQPAARRQIGFCPQHNVFFPQLSVIEHVVLFSMLRGQSRSEAWKTSHLLLDRLGIDSKASSLSGSLSGGMQRRLQMACALAGDASVIVLDEPSSGLDVETRRGLWDLVLGLRGNRTVLISTHFMEEADALGDRVAALHLGVLRCHASPMYLKKAIGTGYRLTFITLGQPRESAIGNVVTGAIPDATVKEVTMNSISYALPAASSGAFPAMFAALEAKRRELGIESIGVGVSTLEEVFLRLCSDIDTSTLTQDEVDGVSREEPQHTMTTGLYLYLLQFYELMKRQLFYIWHKKYSFAIWQVLVPVLVVSLMGSLFVNEQSARAPDAGPRRLHLAMYDPLMQYRVLYHADKQGEEDIRALSDQYPQVKFEPADDIADVVLKAGLDDVMEYHKYLAGIELNETNAKVLFTTTLRHAAPAALSMLANVLARRSAAPAALAVLNEPLDPDKPVTPSVVFNAPKMKFFLYMFTFFVGSVMLFNTINAAHLPILERISGARHLHIMAGCPPELHWLTTLVFRTLVMVVTFIVPVVIVCACDRDDTLDEPVFMMAWFMVMLLGTLAFLPFIFLITFFFNHMGTNTLLSLCVFINMVLYLAGFTASRGSAVAALVQASAHVFPAHAALAALLGAARRAHANAQCTLNRQLCASAPLPGCCESEYKNVACMFCYGSGEDTAPGYFMAVLLAQAIVYMSLVCAMQRGVVRKLYEQFKTATYTPPEKRFQDEMVRGERTYVSRAIGLPTPQISDVMLVSDLHKVHSSLLKKFVAIRGISFSVKKGECLGLLGVNGAGKSSAFRVLTAEDWATRGQVFANGQHREGFSSKYMRGLGYCPQFFGLDEFLTGRQNLRLLLTLRGFDQDAAASGTESWINIVGLEKYMDRKVVGYSGGCQRRLAAAASLSVGAALTLLDEPTSGVDVSARRRVWAALRRQLAAGRAVIISSHSMDEMEALCHRIAIMSGGELCALGTPAALRAAHAAGHAVVIKVRPPPAGLPAGPPAGHAGGGKGTLGDETDSAANVLNQLKGTLVETFDCTLKDEHKTMLHYHINQTMQYSQIFEEMERLKSTFPGFVEDYSVTETTLEEVFLSFARQAEQLDAAAPAPAPKRRRDPEANPRPV